jgi:hypothetical protein
MRQAVVLIHGIGEQKPMGTVRRFVKAVLPGDGTDAPAYRSKPDRMSELFELRVLRSRGRPSTDFYEYYWAYNLSGTNLRDLARWMSGLMMRRWRNVPTGARALWVLSYVTLFSALAFAASGAVAQSYLWFAGLPKTSVAWLLITVVAFVLQYLLVSYLGDAARYLSPVPRNIKLRQQIRSECVKLLRSLHDSGEYERVVVVGHSLGSIIGYDGITHLWQQVNELLPGLDRADVQEMVRRCMGVHVSPQPVVREELSMAAGDLRRDGEGVDTFQRCQLEAWREQRRFGNPWLITDFITIGSPLVHASLLMADGVDDFDERKKERELPTCPPQRDDKGFAYSGEVRDVGMGRKFTPLVLHHAAPFAVTRWTNLYFAAGLGLFGDFVGGPLREVFGYGIRDVAVSTGKWRGLVRRTPLAHTSYWLRQDAAENAGARPDGPVPALFALRRALNLSNLARIVSTRETLHAAAAQTAAPGAEPPGS